MRLVNSPQWWAIKLVVTSIDSAAFLTDRVIV